MSTKFHKGSQYQNEQRATELENGAAHTHSVGELDGKPEHLTGNEHTRQTFEHAQEEHRNGHAATVGHGIAAFGHNDIAALAYTLWEARGCPEGSSDEDWFDAVKELRLRPAQVG
jgi:hypothetical protein